MNIQLLYWKFRLWWEIKRSGYRELYLWHDNGFNNLDDIEMIKAGIVAVRKIKGVFNPKRRVDIDLQVIKETKIYGD